MATTHVLPAGVHPTRGVLLAILHDPDLPFTHEGISAKTGMPLPGVEAALAALVEQGHARPTGDGRYECTCPGSSA